MAENPEEEIFHIQCYKVPCAEMDISELYKIFGPENLLKFNTNGIYLKDVDFTTDIKGCMDKEILINYLVENQNYTLKKMGVDLDNDEKIIVDNTKTVGGHCLTFLNKDNGVLKRQKFYNKFVHSIESGSVRSNIGGHIAEWVNNPEHQLQKTIKNSLESGLLRLEITYYKNQLPTLAEVDQDLNKLKETLKYAPKDAFFFCPIAEQYKQYTTILKENLIIIEPNLNYLLFCRSINTTTEKINGIF